MIRKYRKKSYEFAEERGIFSSLTQSEIEEKYDFICREGWARALGEAVVKIIFGPGVKIKQMYLYNGYDMEVHLNNGKIIKIEIKCRSYDEVFDEAAISANDNKSGFIEEGDGWILEYYDKLDKWWIWDLKEYVPMFREKSYHHKKYTADHKNNYWVVEDAYYFDRSKATLSGTTYS